MSLKRFNARPRGSTLILVVWAVSLLSFFAVALGSRSAFSLGVGQRLEQNLQVSYVAVAGIQRAMQLMREDLTPDFDGLNEGWATRELRFSEDFGPGSYRIRYFPPEADSEEPVEGLVDVERKLNLNTAPEVVLARLIQNIGEVFSESDRLEVVHSILDWRDEDNDKRAYGAEGFYYRGRRTSYECKNGPFESVEELLLVRGMTLDLFQRLAPYVTVYGQGWLNLNTASVAVLQTLGLSDAGVEGIVFYRAGEDNSEATLDDRILTSRVGIVAELEPYIPQEDLAVLAKLQSKKFLGVRSTAFEVTLEARLLERGDRLKLWAVIDRKGSLQVWRER
jgi:type II secretory pathway component PulK